MADQIRLAENGCALGEIGVGADAVPADIGPAAATSATIAEGSRALDGPATVIEAGADSKVHEGETVLQDGPLSLPPEQVDNVALAVMQRRALDVEEKAELDRAMDRAWANLPYHYRWLKDWEYV